MSLIYPLAQLSALEEKIFTQESAFLAEFFPWATDVVAVTFASESIHLVLLAEDGMHVATTLPLPDAQPWLDLEFDVAPAGWGVWSSYLDTDSYSSTLEGAAYTYLDAWRALRRMRQEQQDNFVADRDHLGHVHWVGQELEYWIAPIPPLFPPPKL